MKKTTVVKELTTLTEAQADDAFGRVNKASKRISELTSQVEAEKAKVNEKYKVSQLAADLEAIDFKFAASFRLESEILEENQSIVKRYVDQQHGKTVELTNGTAGYKNNPPAVVVDSEKDEKDIIEAILKKGWNSYITIKKSLNKAVIKSFITTDTKVAKALEKLGITVEPSKSFFIKPKEEDTK